ncbi:MAG: circularly permuted type 2 ATP-grasp protein [Acidimicrobiia bacterium]|nr:circularly permuted type 2 ATP-grasp protein [Acidimicrobiia bacterium]
MLDQAVARYHKLLDTPEFKDLAWADELRRQMATRHLMQGGRPVCPVLRPHFITRRQYTAMTKAAESLYSAMDRVRGMVLENPALMARIELLPAEKMLAGVDPGYPYLAVTSLLDTHLNNGTMQFVECYADGPAGVAYSDTLSELFYDCAPVKKLRKKYKLSKLQGMKRLLTALLTAYRNTGKKKYPRIAIVEFRTPLKTGPSSEYMLLAEYLRSEGYPTEVVTPEQLEYRNGVLCRGDFGIEIVYRSISAQEFLVRFDLAHPLVRAYREGTVCMVNSFRTELVQKKAIFGLLTDETVTASFPAAEKKAIRDHIPWTRLVTQSKTKYKNKSVDLVEFISRHREKLVLKPNDTSTDMHSFRGWESDEAGWQKAINTALRSPYVVQERVKIPTVDFPVHQFGSLDIRAMDVDVYPHIFLGKVGSCSTQITDVSSGFSTIAGMAPTFLLETKS